MADFNVWCHKFGEKLFAGELDFISPTDLYFSLHLPEITAIAPTTQELTSWAQISHTEITAAPGWAPATLPDNLNYGASGNNVTATQGVNLGTTRNGVRTKFYVGDSEKYYTWDNLGFSELPFYVDVCSLVLYQRKGTPEESPILSIHQGPGSSEVGVSLSINIDEDDGIVYVDTT